MIDRKSLQSERTRKTIVSDGGNIFALSGAFLLAAFLLTALFALLGMYPFGPHSILISDLSVQYAPDLAAYKNQLLSGGLQTYSFQIGMGKNTLGLFAYYLASPINFVTFLFPSSMIAEAVLVLITIKLSLASAFMTLFLRKRFCSQSKFAIVFGIMYSFCSYAMVYMINIMWLDGFLLLPLLMYFVEKYLENNRYWWRVALTLLVLFVSGFYIAYMVGIFSFLYLLARLFEENQFTGTSAKKAGRSVQLFLGSAVLAAGISAVILIPAGMDIMGNSDPSIKDYSLDSNFKFVDFLNQLLSGSFDSLSNNKPLVYCGLTVLFLCILFFLNPAFSRRQKGLACGTITFFVLSFNLSVIDLAWQLFDSPNWFQFRYSFLLVFVLLMIAFASLLHLHSLKPSMFVVAGLLFLALLFIVQGFGDMAKEGTRFYINLIIGAFELLCLYAMTGVTFPKSIENLKKYVPALLVIFICAEAVIINPLYMRPKMFGGEVEREPLASAINQAEDLVITAKADMEKSDVFFYRMEVDGRALDSLQPMSAGLYLNYPSISTFNSSSNRNLNRFLKQMGYDVNFNYATASHSYTSLVTDSILGVRYILSEKRDISGYDLISTSANDSLYLQKNKLAFPLMYFAEMDALSFDYYSMEKDPENKNPFLFQNELLASLFGAEVLTGSVYYEANAGAPVLYNALAKQDEPIPLDKTDASSDTISKQTASIQTTEAVDTDLIGEEPVDKELEYGITYLRMSSQDMLSLTYTFQIESADPLFLSIPAVARNDQADVYVNGVYLSDLSSSTYTQILSLGSFEIGETITVSIRADSDAYSILSVLFYYCDTSLFEEQMAAAAANQELNIREAKDGYVSAEITAQKDQLLLTTIPYEKGWTLWVDGVETKITPYQNALISVPVGQGTHTIILSFKSPGLTAGVITSCISLLLFSGTIIFTLRKRKEAL